MTTAVTIAEGSRDALDELERERLDGVRRAADRRKVDRAEYVVRWYPY